MTSCYVARLGVMPPRRRTSTGEPEPSTSPSAPDRTSAPAARPRPAAKAAKATPKDPAAAPAEPLRPASVGRYPVEDLDPVVAHGTRPVKAVVGEHLTVSATVFREGHDAVAATVVLTGADGATSSVPMRHVGVDRWEAEVTAASEGLGHYVVEAWGDPVETWRHRAEVKVPAGLDVELELEEGARVLEAAMAGLPRGKVRDPLKAAIHALRDAKRPGPARLAVAPDPTLTALL